MKNQWLWNLASIVLLAIGLAVYFLYGRTRSEAAREAAVA